MENKKIWLILLLTKHVRIILADESDDYYWVTTDMNSILLMVDHHEQRLYINPF